MHALGEKEMPMWTGMKSGGNSIAQYGRIIDAHESRNIDSVYMWQSGKLVKVRQNKAIREHVWLKDRQQAKSQAGSHAEPT